MTNSQDRRPFSMPYVGHTTIAGPGTATSGVMIARAPWPTPVNKYFVLRKLVATTLGTGLTSGAYLAIWDQDVSNSTPIARGSAGGPLLVVPLSPGSNVSGGSFVNPTMTVLDIDACPQEIFQAGITAYTAASGNITVSFEADVI